MDGLIRDMREAADVILALPPDSRAIVSTAVQLAVMAQKAADELEKRRWIPVEERVPEPYETVFVSVSTKNGYDEPVSYETLAAYEHRAGEWVNGITGSPVTVRDYEHVTHWMPLPEAPEEDET